MAIQPQDIKIGESDGVGGIVKRIFHKSDDLAIYKIDNGLIGTKTSTTKKGEEMWRNLEKVSREFAKIQTLRSMFGKSMHGKLDMELQLALSQCAHGHIESAKGILKDIEQRLLRLLDVQGKLLYLLVCLILVIINATVSLVLASTQSVHEQFVFFFFVITCGSLGGFLSVSRNLNRIEIDPIAPKYMSIISGVSRILIAMIGAAFFYFLMKANIALGIISQSESPFAILAIALAAGFSETLVPNTLKKIESQQASGIE